MYSTLSTIIKAIVQFSIVVKLSAFVVLLVNAVLSVFFSLIVPNCTFLDVFQSAPMVFMSAFGLVLSIVLCYVEISSPK
jgi:hypothetical protein